MEFNFEVGKIERHLVRFKYSRLVNTVWIDVDGNVVERDIFWIWIPASRHYEFRVGQEEQHDVIIDTATQRAGAKFVDPTCRVTVDGNLIGEY